MPSKSRIEAERSAPHQVVALALLATIASTLISWLCHDLASLGPASVGWIAAQAFLLTIPAFVAARLICRISQPIASLIGSMWVLAIPGLMLLDSITFHWIGDRFLSAAVWRVLTDLRSSLAGHVTVNIVLSAGIVLLAASFCAALMLWMSDRIGSRWTHHAALPGPTPTYLALLGLTLVVSSPLWVDFQQTRREMARDSARHPFCVSGLLSFTGGGPAVSDASTADANRSLESAVIARDHQQRQLGIDRSASDLSDLPDVLIVVVESFRRELVDPQAMPSLWEFASRGIRCRAHFSGGNATNHGMFSLLNGLEAIWYERPVRYTPLLNRLFHQAGYELGFFAGHDDWRKFYMDGYLSEQHFDVFEIARPRGLKSDRRATSLASMFLDRRDAPLLPHRPRLALLYLYATHATYHSYVEDQHFQPAADDRFLYPYPESNRDLVWNRYKNSARTVDRFLRAVMRDDRVVIVTGDHGESFLEDGTIGHGIRISEFQNMTPAVIYIPGAEPRSIAAPTMHADLLTTLLSAVGLRLNRPATLDGVDLTAAAEESLLRRQFVTRNYLQDDVGLIGSWTTRSDLPFAYRIRVSLRDLKLDPLNVIDRRGDAMDAADVADPPREWSKRRFGAFTEP